MYRSWIQIMENFSKGPLGWAPRKIINPINTPKISRGYLWGISKVYQVYQSYILVILELYRVLKGVQGEGVTGEPNRED